MTVIETEEALVPLVGVSTLEDNKSSKGEETSFILLIGQSNSTLEKIYNEAFTKCFKMFSVPSKQAAEHLLRIGNIDLIAFVNDISLRKNLEIIRNLRDDNELGNIPVVGFHENDVNFNKEVFEYGVLDSISVSTPDEVLRAKLINLIKFSKNDVYKNKQITQLEKTKVILSKKLEQSESKLEDVSASLRFETIRRKELEQIYSIINRSLTTINAGSQAIISAKSEHEIIQSICDILIENKQYACVWVGIVNPEDSNELDVIANANIRDATHQEVVTRCEEGRFNCAAMEKAMDTGALVINRIKPDSAACEFCCKGAEEIKYNASISVPLKVGEEYVGALNIYTEREKSFDSDELILLENISADLAFGIEALRVKTERDSLFEQLKKNNSILEKKVEERTRYLAEANEKLKELETLKSMFIASMSHELRTPLNAIIGFTGIILQGMSGDLNDKQKDQLTRVYNSSKHLLELIINVIDIAKIEGHEIELYPQNISLKEIVETVIENYKPEINKKGIELELSCSGAIPIYNDSKRIAQAFQNILSNAVKYTEQGSISVSIIEYGQDIRLTVRDTGIGIDMNMVDACFEPFERLTSHLKVKTGGAGLGLYLTRKIVAELLGGTIEVTSVLGQGSIFTLQFPKNYFSK